MIALLVLSCQDNLLKDVGSQEEELLQDLSERDQLKVAFGEAFSKAISMHSELRSVIQEEALKMVNNDYEVLYQMIKDYQLQDGTSISESIETFISEEYNFSQIESSLPLLTILVPSVPNFNPNDWNPEMEVPHIAVRLEDSDDIPIFDLNGEKSLVPKNLVPGFPVLVVKMNERIVLAKNKSLKSASLQSSDNQFSFEFADDSFNGLKHKTKSAYIGKSDIPPFVIDAYNSGLEWHRDNIYYGLSSTKQSGGFNYGIYEYLSSFELQTDSWYRDIADQSDDPKIVPYIDLWTDGAFEFKIVVLIGGKNGVGSTVTKIFPAKGTDIMEPTYTKCYGPRGGPYTCTNYYTVNNIVGKPYNPNVELEEWNLQDYSTAWKLSVYEVDNSQEIVSTEQVSTEFATNFEISSAGEDEKVGFKFGASSKVINTSTFSIKTKMESDYIGDAVLKFSDPIIVGEKYNLRDPSRLEGYYLNEIGTGGYLKMVIMPKRKY